MPGNENLSRWISALATGNLPQTKGVLTRVRPYDFDGSNELPVGNCCLGVACDLAFEAGIVSKRVLDAGSVIYTSVTDESDYSSTTLPKAVRKWLGLGEDNPSVLVGDESGTVEWVALASLNDGAEWTFGQIANAIESARRFGALRPYPDEDED